MEGSLSLLPGLMGMLAKSLCVQTTLEFQVIWSTIFVAVSFSVSRGPKPKSLKCSSRYSLFDLFCFVSRSILGYAV